MKSNNNYSNIPEILRQKKAWGLWRYELRSTKDGKKELTKVPHHPITFSMAKSNKPYTWTSFETAKEWLYRKKYHRLEGLAFFIIDDIVGVDLDDCRNPDTGEIDSQVQEIIKLFGSYSEISPSGTGIRIFCRGKLPPKDRRNGRYEIYDKSSPRFLTVTGNHLPDTPLTVEKRQETIDQFHQKYIARTHKAQAQKPTTTNMKTEILTSPLLKDGRTLRRIFELTTADPKVKTLWQGNWSGSFSSQSEADASLVSKLAFYAGPRPEVVDKLFRKSKLYRPKWDEQRGAKTYGEMTLERYCDRKNYYDWSCLVEEIVTTWPNSFEETPQEKMTRVGLIRWEELKAIAAKQQDRWIIKNILEPGTSTVFSGLPFSGKTTVLAHLMGCIATEREFLGYEIKERCPIIFLNCDRLRERHVVKRISRAFTDPFEEARFTELFFTVNLPKIPLTITADYLAELIGIVKNAVTEIGSSTGLILIDPLRGAFLQELEAGAENDPTTMTQVLKPIQVLARETDWCLVTPHHNNRGRNEYSGTAAIAGNSDGMWNITRDKLSSVSELEIITRDGPLPLLKVEERPEGLFPVGAATNKEEIDHIAEFVMGFPERAEDAVTVADIVSRGWASSRTQVQRMLDMATGGGHHPRLEEIGSGKKGDPLRYFKA